jgi:hypothetical protein
MQKELGKKLKFSLSNFRSRFFQDPITASTRTAATTRAANEATAKGEGKIDYDLPQQRDIKNNTRGADLFEPPPDRKYVCTYHCHPYILLTHLLVRMI